MRLARARWFFLVGLGLSGCLLPNVDLVSSFGDGGTGGGGKAGASNGTAGSATDGAGTSSSEAGSGATPGAGGEPVDPGGGGTNPGSGGTSGSGGTTVDTAGTSAGGKGGSGAAGTSGGGAGGNAGSGGTGLVSSPYSWAAWPMPNAASSSLPNPASYNLGTAGVVRDNVTGLMWQRVVSATMGSFDEAATYCGNLTLASYSDWRVPTRIELVSIIDYSVAPPAAAIDATAFPNTPLERHWTASTFWGNPDYAFQCNFKDGSVYSWAKSGSAGTPSVRCVRK